MASGKQMHRFARTGIVLALPVALLLGFHFWGEKQREREWWWIGGDRGGMTFLDLARESDGEGHLLSTQVLPDAEGVAAVEFDVEWSCSRQQIWWGELWRLDADLLQIDRSPAPADAAEPHRPRSAQERTMLEVACSTIPERAKLRTVRLERNPLDTTRLAVSLLDLDVAPIGALFLGALSPATDPVEYERMLSKYVRKTDRDRARKLVDQKK